MLIKKDETIYWLALNRTAQIGSKRIQSLLCSHRPNLADWFEGDKPTQELREWYQKLTNGPLNIDWQGVEKDLAWLSHSGRCVLYLNHPDYPLSLKHIASPPPVLFLQGNASLLNQPQLAMVGSRRPSEDGRQNAYSFAKQLASWGMVITSGLALGVDSASHQGALDGGGQTIAVLGHGLQQVYPKSNQYLAQAIAEKGLLASEFAIGVGPKREHFPRRNRVISGLSLGIIVVEAAKKSGSLITANYALDQGREIFAFPGSINNPMAEGCHQLIRQGALCIDNPAQVMETLSPQLTEVDWDASIAQTTIKSHKPNPVTNLNPCKEEIHSQLNSSEANILALVSNKCTPFDGIVDQSGLTSQQVSMMLLSLELAGHIKSVPGGVIRL